MTAVFAGLVSAALLELPLAVLAPSVVVAGVLDLLPQASRNDMANNATR
jgi:zinc transporter ZupT